ncbi:MAG TPA: 3-beta hydroxysteroid dehydrogenase [Planctomycetaceae bacterium]|nr:3-beta hydroxysteroid dehydrogenase [Planctomycetaceae bacterium]
MTTVLVTGYGGFLGSAICRQLLAGGYHVRGIARSAYPELAAKGVDCIEASIEDADAVGHAVQGADAIIHTAAKAGVWGPYDSYYRVNTEATTGLLEAACAADVRAFVHTSSPSVTFAGEHQSGVDETVGYPDRWLCAYPQTKALAEQAVFDRLNDRLFGCALRPHLIWGPGDPHLFPRVVKRTLAGRLRRVGGGQNLIDTVHVESAASAHLAALERLLDADRAVSGQAFFLTDGEPVECWQWISEILQTAGVPVPNKSISFRAAYAVGAALETAYRAMGRQAEPPMTRFVAAQLALDHYFSIRKAQQLLGYSPQIDRNNALAECGSELRRIAKSG